MANLKKRLPDNIPGKFYVDDTCIDCDACRILSPNCFKEKNQQSVVYRQPLNGNEEIEVLQALLACPTSSIGSTQKVDLKLVEKSFPLQIEDNVLYCGYHSSDSYGAASYFIQREQGNIMIDSPRFAHPLVERIKSLGGIRYLILTHRDDVADHDRFQKMFRCERVMHSGDFTEDTRNIEIKLEGEMEIQFLPDLLLLPVPGHTRGHIALIYKDKFAFTGDHLAFSPEMNHLIAFKNACWYSWEETIRSMKKLSHYSFEWVLPGHGRRFHSGSKEEMLIEIKKCLEWMEID
ncbi:MAG: MBL fold metallo-hydrolase [Nitrospiria bacterium]